MDNPSRQETLLTWSLAIFHTGFFLVALVLILYGFGSLGGLLSSLNTLLGFVFFGVLWLSTWWTTRQTLTRVARQHQAASFSEMLLGGEKPPLFSANFFSQAVWWGAVNGAIFFTFILGLLLVDALARLFANPGEGLGLINFALLGLIGILIAGVVGAVVAFVLAVIDALLLSSAWRFFLRS